MSEERMAILRMLAEGKIGVDEAERLLQAVGGRAERQPGGRGREGRRKARPQDLGDFFEEIGQEVRRAVKSVQVSEIGRVVNHEVGRAMERVQRADVGRIVGEVVEQVREAVEHGGNREVVEEEMEWTLEGEGLVRLMAETANGNVRFTGVDGGGVRVRACKKVKGHNREEVEAFARQVQVLAEREGEAVRVTREHPRPPRGIQVEVSYEIEGPRALDLDLRTVNGNVLARGGEGGAQVQTTNGNVVLDGARGPVQARTQNGNIQATVGELRGQGLFANTNGNISVVLGGGQAPLTATSTNGNVALKLPEEFCGRLDARTTNGQVRGRIPLAQTEVSKRTHLCGRIGEGGENEVRLHTLNGNIHIAAIGTEEA